MNQNNNFDSGGDQIEEFDDYGMEEPMQQHQQQMRGQQ